MPATRVCVCGHNFFTHSCEYGKNYELARRCLIPTCTCEEFVESDSSKRSNKQNEKTIRNQSGKGW